MVAAGGAGGAVLRWVLGELVRRTGPASRGPRSAINVVGSFVLATLPGARRRPPTRAAWRSRSGPGVLGGFTTLSTYAEQGRGLLADGRTALAAAYLFGTLARLPRRRAPWPIGCRRRTPQWQFDAEEGNE